MGFFTQSQLNKKSKVKVDVDLLESDCLSCGLYKHSEHPKIEVSGEGKKKILIVGEYSNDEEDRYGVALAGDTGESLRRKLKFENVSLNLDCWKINAVRCKNKTYGVAPTQVQIQSCRPYLEKIIKQLKPKLVLAMGSVAINSLFGKDYSNRKMNRWRRYCIPDEKFECHIVPLFSPKQVEDRKKDKNLSSTFDRDLKYAINRLNDADFERKDFEQYITPLKDFERVKKLLNRILKRKTTISYDYETTGLKPFKEGHKIVTIGLAVTAKKAFAFPYQWKNHWTKKEFAEIKRLWTAILKDPKIKKIAHNSKYEEIWGEHFFGVTHDWLFDTMMAEHILDNRAASTGLKFQTFVRYGVRPYDKIIAPFLKSNGKEFNTVEKAPFTDLLLYNGLDCLFCMMLYKDQNREISKRRGLLKAYVFFMKGNKQMAKIQLNGINMNAKYYYKTEKLLEGKIKERKDYLEKGREARAFMKKYNRPILVTSNQDLGKLFYEVLGADPVYTGKGNYKTDKSTLESLNLPFVTKLLEMKKYEKARGTYLGQFAREIYKGKMYPFFDLNIPVSYRGSSSRPNFQNLPKRDKEITELIRMGIIPSPNCILSEIDFSGAEVITSATYHLDKNFINYLVDKSTDMHRDNATDLLMLPYNMLNNPKYSLKQKKLASMIRFFAKNNWTFAQFYGDWFGSCAPVFWENVVEAGLKLPNGMTVRSWLEDKGIYDLGEMIDGKPEEGSFLEHCKTVEEKMWNERFPEYTQWKKDIVQYYRDYGFIENHFGFRFTGYMSDNQCTNFPIQSASFHMLIYTLIEVQKFIDDNKLKTKIIGQIHDSIISDVHKDEIQFYHAGVNKIVKGLKDVFDWLIIPMEIEAEISKLREEGGNFSDMREVKPDTASLDVWKEAA